MHVSKNICLRKALSENRPMLSVNRPERTNIIHLFSEIPGSYFIFGAVLVTLYKIIRIRSHSLFLKHLFFTPKGGNTSLITQ